MNCMDLFLDYYLKSMTIDDEMLYITQYHIIFEYLFIDNIYIYVFQFSPDITSSVPHHKHYALEVTDHCSPVIDSCRIKSTSVGK